MDLLINGVDLLMWGGYLVGIAALVCRADLARSRAAGMRGRQYFLAGRTLPWAVIGMALAAPVTVSAAQDPPALPEVTVAPPEAVAAWQALRFGMFVHWGPVSLTGKEIGWSRGRETPVEIYDQLYTQFDPPQFNADDWVRTAREAGMKYLIITSKHHDGFCLWPSDYTDYDIGESPFGRDVLQELSEACRRQGIRFGTYHSTCDWHHPAFPLGSPGGTSKKPNPDLAAYDRYLQGQVQELVTRYGPLVSLWFDVPQVYTAEYGIPMVNRLRRLQPDIVINNRAYAEPGRVSQSSHQVEVGDFSTPEQRVGGFDRERPWETCMTICNQWAWKPEDPMKSLEQCVQTLLRVVGGDGNFLFNVGPMPDGRIEPRQVERLREMGAWVTRYGEGIYGTRGGPYMPGNWGASTCKGTTVYLYVMNWPADGPLVLPTLPAHVRRAECLSGGQVQVVQEEDALRVLLPAADRQPIATVIRLDLDRTAFDVPPVKVPKTPSGSAAFAKPAQASNVHQAQAAQYGPQQAFDDDPETRWATDSGTAQAWISVDLGQKTAIGRAWIDEREWNRVRRYELQAQIDGQWTAVHTGTTIGPGHAVSFPPQTARHWRLEILETTDGPTLWELHLLPPE